MTSPPVVPSFGVTGLVPVEVERVDPGRMRRIYSPPVGSHQNTTKPAAPSHRGKCSVPVEVERVDTCQVTWCNTQPHSARYEDHLHSNTRFQSPAVQPCATGIARFSSMEERALLEAEVLRRVLGNENHQQSKEGSPASDVFHDHQQDFTSVVQGSPIPSNMMAPHGGLESPTFGGMDGGYSGNASLAISTVITGTHNSRSSLASASTADRPPPAEHCPVCFRPVFVKHCRRIMFNYVQALISSAERWVMHSIWGAWRGLCQASHRRQTGDQSLVNKVFLLWKRVTDASHRDAAALREAQLVCEAAKTISAAAQRENELVSELAFVSNELAEFKVSAMLSKSHHQNRPNSISYLFEKANCDDSLEREFETSKSKRTGRTRIVLAPSLHGIRREDDMHELSSDGGSVACRRPVQDQQVGSPRPASPQLVVWQSPVTSLAEKMLPQKKQAKQDGSEDGSSMTTLLRKDDSEGADSEEEQFEENSNSDIVNWQLLLQRSQLQAFLNHWKMRCEQAQIEKRVRTLHSADRKGGDAIVRLSFDRKLLECLIFPETTRLATVFLMRIALRAWCSQRSRRVESLLVDQQFEWLTSHDPQRWVTCVLYTLFSNWSVALKVATFLRQESLLERRRQSILSTVVSKEPGRRSAQIACSCFMAWADVARFSKQHLEREREQRTAVIHTIVLRHGGLLAVDRLMKKLLWVAWLGETRCRRNSREIHEESLTNLLKERCQIEAVLVLSAHSRNLPLLRMCLHLWECKVGTEKLLKISGGGLEMQSKFLASQMAELQERVAGSIMECRDRCHRTVEQALLGRDRAGIALWLLSLLYAWMTWTKPRVAVKQYCQGGERHRWFCKVANCTNFRLRRAFVDWFRLSRGARINASKLQALSDSKLHATRALMLSSILTWCTASTAQSCGECWRRLAEKRLLLVRLAVQTACAKYFSLGLRRCYGHSWEKACVTRTISVLQRCVDSSILMQLHSLIHAWALVAFKSSARRVVQAATDDTALEEDHLQSLVRKHHKKRKTDLSRILDPQRQQIIFAESRKVLIAGVFRLWSSTLLQRRNIDFWQFVVGDKRTCIAIGMFFRVWSRLSTQSRSRQEQKLHWQHLLVRRWDKDLVRAFFKAWLQKSLQDQETKRLKMLSDGQYMKGVLVSVMHVWRVFVACKYSAASRQGHADAQSQRVLMYMTIRLWSALTAKNQVAAGWQKLACKRKSGSTMLTVLHGWRRLVSEGSQARPLAWVRVVERKVAGCKTRSQIFALRYHRRLAVHKMKCFQKKSQRLATLVCLFAWARRAARSLARRFAQEAVMEVSGHEEHYKRIMTESKEQYFSKLVTCIESAHHQVALRVVLGLWRRDAVETRQQRLVAAQKGEEKAHKGTAVRLASTSTTALLYWVVWCAWYGECSSRSQVEWIKQSIRNVGRGITRKGAALTSRMAFWAWRVHATGKQHGRNHDNNWAACMLRQWTSERLACAVEVTFNHWARRIQKRMRAAERRKRELEKRLATLNEQRVRLQHYTSVAKAFTLAEADALARELQAVWSAWRSRSRQAARRTWTLHDADLHWRKLFDSIWKQTVWREWAHLTSSRMLRTTVGAAQTSLIDTCSMQRNAHLLKLCTLFWSHCALESRQEMERQFHLQLAEKKRRSRELEFRSVVCRLSNEVAGSEAWVLLHAWKSVVPKRLPDTCRLGSVVASTPHVHINLGKEQGGDLFVDNARRVGLASGEEPKVAKRHTIQGIVQRQTQLDELKAQLNRKESHVAKGPTDQDKVQQQTQLDDLKAQFAQIQRHSKLELGGLSNARSAATSSTVSLDPGPVTIPENGQKSAASDLLDAARALLGPTNAKQDEMHSDARSDKHSGTNILPPSSHRNSLSSLQNEDLEVFRNYVVQRFGSAEKAFRQLDSLNRNQRISLVEFEDTVCRRWMLCSVPKARQLFKALDINSDGELTLNEFSRALAKPAASNSQASFATASGARRSSSGGYSARHTAERSGRRSTVTERPSLVPRPRSAR